MVKVIRQGVYYKEGRLEKEAQAFMTSEKKRAAMKNTVTHTVLSSHNKGDELTLKLKADALLTAGSEFAEIVRVLDALGVKKFPVPFYCVENALDEEDPFCKSAVKKFGGVFVPAGAYELYEYARVAAAKGGAVMLSTEGLSCGALGNLVFQTDSGDIISRVTGETYDIPCPETVAVFLKGKLRSGVGPLDVALAIAKAAGSYAENKIFEFFGPALSRLTQGERNSIDEYLFHTNCLASVWATDEKTEDYFKTVGRAEDYKPLAPKEPAFYDGAITVDLSRVEPMIAVDGLIWTGREAIESPQEFLKKADEAYMAHGGEPRESYLQFLADGKIVFSEGAINYGSYETLARIAEMLRGKQTAIPLNVCYDSKPVRRALDRGGYLEILEKVGIDETVCGLIAADEASYYRYFIMDPRTVAATVLTGSLTSALNLEYNGRIKKYKHVAKFDERGIVNAFGKAEKIPLKYDGVRLPLDKPAPIADLLLLVWDVNTESVRSSVLFFDIEFDDEVAKNALGKNAPEGNRQKGAVFVCMKGMEIPDWRAWENAFSLHRAGYRAVIAKSYTPKFRKRLLEWGIVPFTCEKPPFKEGEYIDIEALRPAIESGEERIVAKILTNRKAQAVALTLGPLTEEERKLLLDGGKYGAVKRG